MTEPIKSDYRLQVILEQLLGIPPDVSVDEDVTEALQKVKDLMLELIGDDYPSDYAKRKGYDAGVIATIEVNQRLNDIRKKVAEL